MSNSIGHDAQRVEVAPGVGGFAADLLGCQVLHRAGDGAGLGLTTVGVGAGEPEVGHLHHALGRDEHVLGLDVAVHDALAVRVFQAQQGLAHDVDGLGGFQSAVLVQERAGGPAAHVLHDHVVDAVDRAPVEDGHDVGVGQAGRGARFPAEPVDERLVARERPVQHLDRHLTVQDRVAREEDFAHTARRDALHHVVAPVEGDECMASGTLRRRRLGDTSGRGALLLLGEALGGRARSGADDRAEKGLNRGGSRNCT